MTDATLAAIGIELERLREGLKMGTVKRAAVVLLVDDRAYLSLKADSEDDAKGYLGAGFLQLIERGGLATKEEIDAA